MMPINQLYKKSNDIILHVFLVGLKWKDQNVLYVIFFCLVRFSKYILVFSITLQVGLLRSMVVTLFDWPIYLRPLLEGAVRILRYRILHLHPRTHLKDILDDNYCLVKMVALFCRI